MTQTYNDASGVPITQRGIINAQAAVRINIPTYSISTIINILVVTAGLACGTAVQWSPRLYAVDAEHHGQFGRLRRGTSVDRSHSVHCEAQSRYSRA